MSDAIVITRNGKPAVRLERMLPDPPPVVWRAITVREELRAWFPCDVVVEGGSWDVGAPISFVFPSEVVEMTLAGEVLIVEEPRTLSYTWGNEILRFELTAVGGGTQLVLIDELAPGGAARNAAGWDECLDRLVGLDPGPAAWQTRFAAYAAAFTPQLGPQEGPPPGYQGDRAE